jgi:RNA polymerase II subunit A small phosphatase-like protein
MYQHALQRRKKKKKYTLVLDLDETLVHTTDKPLASYDCRVEIRTKKANRVFYILKRPFLDHFLVTVSGSLNQSGQQSEPTDGR